MKTITQHRFAYIILLCALFFSSFVSAQTPDFNVQHVQDDIGNTGGTNTSFSAVSSLNSAFALAKNNRKVNAGLSNLTASNLNGDDLSGARVLTGTNTLTYYRQAGSDTGNMRFNSSLWEYIGPVGGDNEMIVRGRYSINLNGNTDSVTQAISGISNANDCIPFITGITNTSTAAGADSGTALAYLENATTLRVEKGTTSNNVTVYITLVEFTGSNWTVLHGDSGITGTQIGSITLRDGSDGTGTATNVSGWNNAIIFSQHKGDNDASGTNYAIEDNWPLIEPGTSNQFVDWSFSGTYGSNGTNRHFVHILNNPNLNVLRFQNTSNSAGETTIDITSAGLSNLNQSLIVGTSVSNGGGTAYARGWRNYYLNSTTQAAHWSHRSGNNMSHEIQIVDLSNLTSAASYCSSFGNTTWETGVTNVMFESINNSDGPLKDVGYEDFTTTDIATVSQGGTETLSVSVNTDGPYTIGAVAWIDWNQNLDFTDPGEEYNLGTANNVTSGTTTLSPLVINIPAGATLGTTRMRVSARFNAYPTSCQTGYDGEVEDYRIIVNSGVAAPEINITGNTLTITDGDTTPDLSDFTDFGDVITTTGTRTHLFTIENMGSLDLNLTDSSPFINITGAHSGDFNLSSIPSPTIATGGTTTFEISFTPGADGLRTASVSIANNDSDENPYNFTIQGTGYSPPEHTIYYENFDESDGGWTAGGTGTTVWSRGTGLSAAGEIGEGNYWFTDTYNTYSDNIYITATSPILSTTGFDDLVFNVDLTYDFNVDDDDGMRIEYRKRTSGVWTSWNVLGAFGDGSNWYDGNGTVDALSAGSDGWTGTTRPPSPDILNFFRSASISLPSVLNDSAEVQFRFVVASDAADVDKGAAFDNIIIEANPIVPFSNPAIGPGSVNNDLRLWLKATEAWGVLNDNDDVLSLQDAAFDNDAIGLATSSPAFKDNLTDNINYNPVIDFDRSDEEYLRGKGGFYAQDYFVVIKSNGTIDNSGTNRQVPIAGRVAPISPQVDGTGLGLGSISARFTDEVVAHMSSSVPTSPGVESYGRALTSTTESFTDEIIIYNIKTNATGTNTEIYKNGKRIDNITGQAFDDPVFNGTLNFFEFLNQQYYLGVGRFSLNGNIGAYVDGKITEIISYKASNSALDKQKIESYLALKNGVTLHASGSITADRLNDIDYIDSQGNVIWDTSVNTGYNYDIAGIGRDDDSGFSQKQSASENKFSDGSGLTSGFLSIGLTDLYDTNKENIDNNTTDFNDREYLVWGNNNADINSTATTITVNMSAGITPALTTNVTFTAMQRVWKVVESGGDIPTAKVRIPLNAVRDITPPGNYYMFISDTGIFDPTADYRVMTPDGSGNLDAEYDFDGTKYITFGYAPQVVVERSVYFDGAVDYIDMEDNLNLDPTGFTLSSWIKRDAADSGTKSIVSKRDAAFTQGYDFRILNNNRIQIFWKNGSDQILTSNTSIPDEQWHHVAAIYDGSEIELYIDGVLDNSATTSAPVATNESFYIAAAGKNTPVQHFRGNIDEVRVWDVALNNDQLRFIMNQEIEDNAGQVMGTILPTTVAKNDINSIPWTDLAGYYPMSVYTYTNTDDASGNGNQGALRNLNTVDIQTAPLPYESDQNGNWDTNATWVNGDVQYLPGSTSIVDTNRTVDWNIVRTSHDITMDNSSLPASNQDNRELLGLYVDANELTLAGDNSTNTGNGITVSHYLSLTGKIDLEGDSQLIQPLDSDLDVAVNGELEKDQQGTADTYTYNYWSSPVGEVDTAKNDYRYTVQDVMFDGTNSINFTPSGFNGSASTPITIADYWIWKFSNQPTDDYSAWQHVRRTGTINAGEGFTMKGPGTGPISADQNYVFLGKPNNGDINLTLNAGNDYLVGNPYPSAIDADQFIMDNGPELGYTGGADPTPLTSGTLYFWEHWGGGSHVLAEYQGGYATYNFSGSVAAASLGTNDPDVATGGTPSKLPGRYIPVGQGFFVVGENTGTINFNNGQRVFQKEGSANSIFVRSANTSTNYDAEEIDDRMKFRIGFNSINTIHRQLLLTIDENATPDADWAYDAVLNEDQMDDMFWMINDSKYVIQASDEAEASTVYPIGIKTDSDGINTIAIDALENVPSSIDIYIHDSLLNTYHDLRASDFEIFLNAGEYLDRFNITFSANQDTLGIVDDIQNNIDIVYSNDIEKIVLINPNGIQVKSIELFNLLGQSITTFNDISESGYSEYDVENLSTGTYIIKLHTVSGSVSKKVLVN